MSILVDYRCTTCRLVFETFVDSPAPSLVACASCGDHSSRMWSPVGLVSGSPEVNDSGSGGPDRSRLASPALCKTNPDVPGLCHMSETAGRAWVARYRGDNRALDVELGRQEEAARITPPTMADAITHHHFADHTDSAL